MPQEKTERKQILITVITYPHPSRKYQELICTAGITKDKEWVRLYPIDYRYQPKDKQFRKYQWIEVDLLSHGHGNDRRKESRQPVLDSLNILGPQLSSKNAWLERRQYIDIMPHHTLNKLVQLYDSDRISLGIVRPAKILDLKIKPTPGEWKPEWKILFDQMRLFDDPPKILRKLPLSFHYVFECEDSQKPHTAMIEDWELGVLFLKEIDRLGSEDTAAESVRKKYLDEICSPDKDTRFFMGTRFPYNTWLVLGVFWPPKEQQLTLF